MMLSQQSQGATLSIVAHGATNLKDVEMIGKQDPYLRFTLDFNNPKSFQKTFVHKDAGKNAVWNQSFTVPLNGEPEIYVEIMDEETTADAVVAFAAIPINQVVHAPGGCLNGIFDVFTADGKQNGQLNMTLTAHNVPGQNTSIASQAATPVRGQSHIAELHHKRIKSIKNKERAADTGMAVAGGLLALGAGFLANKVIGDEKKKDEARKEAAHQADVEREQFEREKKKLEEERMAFERSQTEERARITQQTSYEGHSSSSSTTHTERREEHQGDHHHDKHHDKHHGHNQSRDWDPVGNYTAGDKVSYHGRQYICLQGHQSNPTWEPTQAHSLWRAD
ncbi:hypothetical protein BGZ99_006483 [Dissophora globulifera]|uniref:C2 domain-containing protein n=1 Tax=Dissophora globulifera TaxID=979702 RepID=A0A9P6RWZ3_9FUNG|nr:hypothetical protein BGZ99_006483 [Dissophora globulifera]